MLSPCEGTQSELLYADDFVMMSEIIEGLRDKFLTWKEAFESKCLKVNLGKIKVMVSSGIIQDNLSNSKVDQCWVCSLRVKASSVLCAQCGRWTHSRCARVLGVTPWYLKNFTCRKCEWNIGEAVEQDVMKWKL